MARSTWVLYSVLIATACIFCCAGLLWLLRKKVAHEKFRKHHDVAGFMLGTIGVLYSVILGFTVINTKERYTEAEKTVHTEAVMLTDLYRDAEFFPNPTQKAVRTRLRDYLEYILQEEWGRKGNLLLAQRAVHRLWHSYDQVDLKEESARIWYSLSASKIDQLMDARISRGFFSREHLGPMMWAILIVGAVITIGFMFFFSLENVRNQMVMMSLVAGYLSFMLYLVYCLDNPFRGPLAIQPNSLNQALILFDDLDQESPYTIYKK